MVRVLCVSPMISGVLGNIEVAGTSVVAAHVTAPVRVARLAACTVAGVDSPVAMVREHEVEEGSDFPVKTI
jgi:hypothetical protein